MKCILIKDCDERGILSVKFKEILEDINVFEGNLQLALYELEASVVPPGIPGFSNLLEQINNSVNGYLISWDKLVKLAEGLNQVVDLVLVGSNSSKCFVAYENENYWIEQFNICVEMLDGDYWEIYTSNEDLVKNLSEKYRNTEIVSLNSDLIRK